MPGVNPELNRVPFLLVAGMLALVPMIGVSSASDASDVIWLPSAERVFPDHQIRSPQQTGFQYLVRAPHEYSARSSAEEFALAQRIIHPAERDRQFEDLPGQVEAIRLDFSRPVAGTLILETGREEDVQEVARVPVNGSDKIELIDNEFTTLTGSLYELSARLKLRTNVLEVYWEPAGLGSPLAIEFLIRTMELAEGTLMLKVNVPDPDRPEGRLTDLALEEHRKLAGEVNDPLRIEFVSGIDSSRRIDEVGYWLRPISEIVPEE